MMIRVIYQDQSAGVIERHLLDTLIRKGRIVAYHAVGKWVPVHSKNPGSDPGVAGIERYPDKLRKCTSF